MTARIKDGLRAAAGHPGLVCLIWAVYSLLSLVPALPAWTWWNGVLGYSPEAGAGLKRFSLGVFLDLTRSGGAAGLSPLVTATVAAGIVALIASAFVFGGVLEVLGSGDERRPFMHRFSRGGGRFFWRFVRLGVIAGVCLILGAVLMSALAAPVMERLGDSEWEPAGYLGALAGVAAFLLVAALFLLALDYARIRVARDDARSMLKAYAAGLGFVLRRLPATYGIAIAFVAIETALVLCYLAYETYTPAAGSWGAIAALVLAQQIVVVGRVFVRVALIGAERSLYAASVPAAWPAALPGLGVPAAAVAREAASETVAEAPTAAAAPAAPATGETEQPEEPKFPA